MAILNKTGITNGGTIQAEHVTRTIDALTGGSTDTIVATGSFSGSLQGVATSASFATTASFALNAGGGTGVGFPFTGSARITGSLAVTGSLSVVNSFVASGSYLAITAEKVAVGTLGPGVETTYSNKTSLDLTSMNNFTGFRIPVTASASPALGSMYFDEITPALWIYDGSGWRGFEPTLT
jgi:hypothetical protein